MVFSRRILYIIFSLALLIGVPVLSAQSDCRSSVRQATSGFKDLTVKMEVAYKNEQALKKISDDFAKTYEFKDMIARVKSPDKLRMDGKLGVFQACLVVNGDKKAFKVPAVKLSKKENIKGKSHMRQTELDFGVLTESLWQDYCVTGSELINGSEGRQYKISFDRIDDRKRHFIAWVDSDTLKVLRIEERYDDGDLRLKSVFSNHRKVNGIWVPGRVEFYNIDGKLAAITNYTSVSVNSGMADSVFKL